MIKQKGYAYYKNIGKSEYFIMPILKKFRIIESYKGKLYDNGRLYSKLDEAVEEFKNIDRERLFSDDSLNLNY